MHTSSATVPQPPPESWLPQYGHMLGTTRHKLLFGLFLSKVVDDTRSLEEEKLVSRATSETTDQLDTSVGEHTAA